MKITVLLAALLSASVAFAGPPAPKKTGIEGEGYVWNAQEGEKMEALHLKGDVVNGEEAYEICGACHLPSGAGRPDGTFPQLAGQHTTVLIKQMADIRAGLRDNPTMYPFAATLTDAEGRVRLRYGVPVASTAEAVGANETNGTVGANSVADSDTPACPAYLLRPDQHVCARWLHLTPARLNAALHTATARPGVPA